MASPSAPYDRPPLVRPPALRTSDETAQASRLELFFDLAYVLVVIELGKAFYADLTWHGLAVVVGLFVAVWVSWVGFTLYANRFDTDDVVFRLAKLAATAGIGGCAAAASDAVGKYAVPFAVCFLLGRVLLLALYLRAWRHVPDGRPTIRVYLAALSVSSLLWAVSLGVPEPVRYLLWVVAVLVDGLGPVLATLRTDRLPLHIEHLPERFGLLIILVLGEALGGATRGIHDAGWAAPSIVIGVGGLVVTAAMWWIYFDIASDASTSQLEDANAEPPGEDTSRHTPADGEDDSPAPSSSRHDMFVYGHLPMALGTLIVGVGLEDLVVHRDTGAEWVLVGGLASFLIGIALVIGGTTRRWASVWPWPLAFIAVPPLTALVPLPNAWTFTWSTAAVLVVLAVHGTAARRSTQTAT